MKILSQKSKTDILHSAPECNECYVTKQLSTTTNNMTAIMQSVQKDIPRIRLQIAVLAMRMLLNDPRMCTLLKNKCTPCSLLKN